MQITDKGVVTTVNELATALKVEYPTAAGLIKLMLVQGAAKETGKRPTATGKGKPSTVYTIDSSFTIDFAPKAKAPKVKADAPKAKADAPKATKVEKPAAAPKAKTTKVAKPAVAAVEPAASGDEGKVEAA